MMKSVAFYTLGCKVNQYETETMEDLFVERGYQVTDFNKKADVYVINTCTVTHHGDSKSRQAIRRARKKNPKAVVVVVGCYVQVSADDVLAIPGVDLVIGTAGKHEIVDLVEMAAQREQPIKAVTDIEGYYEFEEMALQRRHTGRTRAFVKIQEGCRQFCTYCIIPYARGPLRSRLPGRVLEQVERLADLGYKEVVLTGIHVTSYGKDLEEDIGLLDIIKAIHQIKGIERIRLSSLEPTFLTQDAVEILARLDKVCRHFHLSLQSGCNQTLERMGRRYTTEQYRSIVNNLRERMPEVAVTTDVMVGFPGETDYEFECTYRFLEDIKLSNMHVFKYSPRKGTPAAVYSGQVPPNIKEYRSKVLLELAERLRKEFHDRFLGKTVEVLFEQKSNDKKGYFEGLTDNYIKVLVEGSQDLSNEIRKVFVTGSNADYMTGDLV
jgi:threonylcarbamoyladenosine tRNA methylthiotransferase MtaB